MNDKEALIIKNHQQCKHRGVLKAVMKLKDIRNREVKRIQKINFLKLQYHLNYKL